jgi:KaiC/GvpD/RAD55 family RecA-like ATPase
MGRTAHTIGIASGLALAVTALLYYGMETWDFLIDSPEYIKQLKWMIPLVTGVVVALASLAVKWVPYTADREDPHFIMSVAAAVVPSIFIALLLINQTDLVLFGGLNWLYPFSILGISLTLISFAMTWEGTSSRKTISILAAVFPALLLSLLAFYEDDPEEAVLAMAYLGSAVSVQLSGSMLHIIASSTSVQQREVLKASDGKLREQVIELEKKRKAIAFREDALRSRESDLEVYEKRLEDEFASIEDKKEQLVAMEQEIEQRLQGIRESRQGLAKQEAAIEREREILQLKLSDIETQRREFEKLAKAMATKEAAVAARERDSNKLLLDAQAKEREIRNRLAEVVAEEQSFEIKRKELENARAALNEREKQIELRASALEMRHIEVAAAKEQLGKTELEKTTIKNLQQQLMMKEEALSEKEMSLRALEADIRKRGEKAERLSARADQQMNELLEKESSVLAREKQLHEKEAQLKAELESINSRLEEMQTARASVSDQEKHYAELTESTRVKMTSLSTKEEEINRKMAALEKREEKIKELNQALSAEKEQMDAKLRELLEKEKDLKAQEAEVSLRRAELKSMEREVLERVDEVEQVRAEMPAEVEERMRALEFREKRLAEKERETKARLYQREKDLEKKESALRAQLQKDLEEVEEAVEEEKKENKIKSGIERLDDLLLGGIPFESNVLCIGPPFIGKEVAMLLFIAEGLKKGVPAVIVTTSHSVDEISKQIAPILPTLKEFEQFNLVKWVDATGMPPAESNGLSEGDIVHVSGPGDFDGILKALEGYAKLFAKENHPYFRLIYMSLSMSITQSSEKAGFQFVQNLAGRMKQAKAISLYAVEKGMHTEQQLESIQHHMSGAIQFKTEKQKTLLSVQGICDVQTREWIQYRHTNKAVMIGAFSLERIR